MPIHSKDWPSASGPMYEEATANPNEQRELTESEEALIAHAEEAIAALKALIGQVRGE